MIFMKKVIFLAVCMGLVACGQKGPLYLPQPDKPSDPQATSQLPATEESAKANP